MSKLICEALRRIFGVSFFFPLSEWIKFYGCKFLFSNFGTHTFITILKPTSEPTKQEKIVVYKSQHKLLATLKVTTVFLFLFNRTHHKMVDDTFNKTRTCLIKCNPKSSITTFHNQQLALQSKINVNFECDLPIVLLLCQRWIHFRSYIVDWIWQVYMYVYVFYIVERAGKVKKKSIENGKLIIIDPNENTDFL